MVKVYTAFASYKDADSIDVSRAGNEQLIKAGAKDVIGIVFAPSWAIIKKAVTWRKVHGLSEEQYAQLMYDYMIEMRKSYKEHKSIWESILKREQVTFTCFCKMPNHCHRTFLAKDILPKLGATYCGEWQGVLL